MKFCADENVPRQYVSRLRADGYDVLYIVEHTRSLGDLAIIHAAVDADAIIITLDKDYWRLIIKERRPSPGAIWLRLTKMPRSLRTEHVAEVIAAYQSQLPNHFTTIYPDRIEQEPIPPDK